MLAPEHPDVLRLNDSPEVHDYVNRSLNESPEERGDEHKQKTGVPLGRTVTNPATGEEIPMYVADYVLMEYGTGAVMGVPAHDARDFEFAEQFGIEIRRVIDCGELPCTDDGPMVNSGRFDGLHNREAYDQIVDWLESEGKGKRSVNYRLRDWLLSRQRYWGCPIPMLYCETDGLVAVPDDQLPVELPDVQDYAPKGKSPLATADGLGEHHLPEVRRAGAARDRHDGHVRRLVLVLPALLRPAQRRGAVGPRGAGPLDAGRPVHRRRRARDPAPDVRALLREGARGHGPARRAGAVRAALHPGHDHARRREDVQVEGERGVAARTTSSASARTRRAATSCSSGRRRSTPTGRTPAWAACTASCRGCGPRPRRRRSDGSADDAPGEAGELLRKAHWAIDKVTHDMQTDFGFNTAIAAVMELTNEIYRQRESAPPGDVRFAVATAGSLIFPFAPHLGSEVFEMMTGRRVWEEPWPKADPALLERDEIQLVVQVNGKLIDRLAAPASASSEQLEELARASDKLSARLNGKEIVKTVVVPGKLVNFVIR